MVLQNNLPHHFCLIVKMCIFYSADNLELDMPKPLVLLRQELFETLTHAMKNGSNGLYIEDEEKLYPKIINSMASFHGERRSFIKNRRLSSVSIDKTTPRKLQNNS